MSDPHQPREFIVSDDEAGQRLDQFVTAYAADLSRSRIKTLLQQGYVVVDDQPAKPALKLRPGQRVCLTLPMTQPAKPQALAMPLDIIFEDDDLLVVNKPAGLVMHPAPGHNQDTLVNGLIARYGESFSVGGEMRPGIVHRLDKGTTGLVLIARNDASLQALQQQFQQRQISKRYLAVVAGDPGAKGSLDTPFARHPRDRKRYTSKAHPSGVWPNERRARLNFVRREQFTGATLIEVLLGTGRTHQIRVQFSDLGHPLLGDTDYGGAKRALPFARPALHAWRLGFTHPCSGESMDFEAPIPTDLMTLIEALRA